MEGLIKELAAVDAVAVDILTDKHLIVEMDSKRNKGREALRQLRTNHPNVREGESQSWMCFGNTFIKVDTATCAKRLEKDLEALDVQISSLRDGLKSKVAQLQKIEGEAESKGFNLKGMSLDEVLNIGETKT